MNKNNKTVLPNNVGAPTETPVLTATRIDETPAPTPWRPSRADIGANMRALRIASGVSQSELARKIGVKQQNISRWEAGLHVPNAEDCIRLADYFHVSLDELVGRLFD